MNEKYRVAGYVKLAKLWERAEKEARIYHREYYENKVAENDDMELVDVYVDITGEKQIYKREAMIRLLKDCSKGKIDCILTQTKGYLAANNSELCYLLFTLFDMPTRIDIITEDTVFKFDTVMNVDMQREALERMAKEYIACDAERYCAWRLKVNQAIAKLICGESSEQ